MENYFLNTATGQERRGAFFDTKASLDFGNAGMTYRQLALINAEGIMVSSVAPQIPKFPIPTTTRCHGLATKLGPTARASVSTTSPSPSCSSCEPDATSTTTLGL